MCLILEGGLGPVFGLEVAAVACCDWPLKTTSLLFTPPQFLSHNTASSSSSLRPLPSSRCERKYHLEPDSHQQPLHPWRALTKLLLWRDVDNLIDWSTCIYNIRHRFCILKIQVFTSETSKIVTPLFRYRQLDIKSKNLECLLLILEQIFQKIIAILERLFYGW